MVDFGLVSIITPSFNCSRFISKTIESIQAQTYSNWELIITDDCSTDESINVIQSFIERDNRIKLFRLKENSGAGVARNNSIKAATGRYIAFCDSDDCWFPEKLEKQLSFMNKENCSMSYTSYMTCTEDGLTNGIVVCRNRETFGSTLRDDKIGCLTLIYDTEKVGKVFMPILRKRQDWALKLLLLKKCSEAFGLKEPLAYYRICQNSISRNKFDLIKYNIAVYRNICGWNAIKSYLYFSFIFLPSYTFKRVILKIINQ